MLARTRHPIPKVLTHIIPTSMMIWNTCLFELVRLWMYVGLHVTYWVNCFDTQGCTRKIWPSSFMLLFFFSGWSIHYSDHLRGLVQLKTIKKSKKQWIGLTPTPSIFFKTHPLNPQKKRLRNELKFRSVNTVCTLYMLRHDLNCRYWTIFFCKKKNPSEAYPHPPTSK